MRKLMLGMLLAAGATLPTLAAARTMTQDRPPEAGQHRGGGEHPHGQGARAEQPRAAPAAQAQPRAQAQPQAQAQVQVRAQAPAQVRTQAQGQARFDGRGDGGRFRGDGGERFGGGDRQRVQPQAQPQAQVQAQTQPGYRGAQGGPNRPPQAGYGRPQGGPGGYAPGQHPQDYGRAVPQYRGSAGNQGGYRQGGNWSRGWRTDQRYDWGRYRAGNRGAFHLPRYDAPRGWGYGYRRFSPGITLSGLLFDQGFWIEDPYAYRLPPAYGPYRWVRYYNDALLVDVRSGYVVDTVYDIFW